MKDIIEKTVSESIQVKEQFFKDNVDAVLGAARQMATCFTSGHKILIFGNGGSAADAQHIAGEFVSRFAFDRPGLAAIALTTDTSILTAIGNDYGFEHVFSRLIEAHGEEGDVAIAISTSGNSPNLLTAVDEARARRIRTIALLGRGGGKLLDRVDLALVVPSDDTMRIQESHIALGHSIVEVAELLLFPELCGA